MFAASLMARNRFLPTTQQEAGDGKGSYLQDCPLCIRLDLAAKVPGC